MTWWPSTGIYQIYPRSFQDSNADGVGDLPGITQRLDYIQWLGVGGVWISPFYPSPMVDFGYDVTDHTDVDPLFGTLDDFDRLLGEAHRRDLRVLIDYVPNHTSDQHPWFLESRSSRDHARREWYIWRDPAPDGGPPNNWLSAFGGSAWQWDEPTRQYYLHSYLKDQPDLNWRNPEVRQAMLGVLRFWLDRGVDGFRIDAVSRLVKDEHFRDDPPNPEYEPGEDPYHQLIATYSRDRPELEELLREMRYVAAQHGNPLLIGEAYLPPARLFTYYEMGIHFPFNFELIRVRWASMEVRRTVDAYEGALAEGHSPNWVLGNHDKPRVASRIGLPQARVAAMLQLTLRGVPILYYGEELGMQNVPIPPDRVQDPWERNVPGLGLGRDPARTPMQWNDGPQAGFTASEPWLPLAEDYQECNVAAQQQDARSMLQLYRRLLELRNAEDALQVGLYVPLATNEQLLAYRRELDGRCLVVVLNFSGRPAQLDDGSLTGAIHLSTHLDRKQERVAGSVSLRPNEGVIIANP